MIMGSTGSICHGRQLIPVAINPLLSRKLSSHESPLAILLRSQIMKVPQVPRLLRREFLGCVEQSKVYQGGKFADAATVVR